jgi:hypothetical protein
MTILMFMLSVWSERKENRVSGTVFKARLGSRGGSEIQKSMRSNPRNEIQGQPYNKAAITKYNKAIKGTSDQW